MALENDDFDIRVRRLKIFLDPKRSKLRPYLALFGVKNYLLLKNGSFINNNPSIKWYCEQLAKAGVSENYWGVRRQLKKMARLDIFKEKKVWRPVNNSTQFHNRLTQIQLSEFYLNEKIYLALHRGLCGIFKVDSLSSLLDRKDLKNTFPDQSFLAKIQKDKKQTSKRTKGVYRI